MTRTASLRQRAGILSILLGMLLSLMAVIATPQPAFADGAGSSQACEDMAGNNNGGTASVPSGQVITSICFKAGQIHSEVISADGVQSGTYEKNDNEPNAPYSYTVTGIGTTSVTVTQSEGPGLSHVDYVAVADPEVWVCRDGNVEKVFQSGVRSGEQAYDSSEAAAADPSCADAEPTPGVSFTDSTQCGVFTVTVTNNDDMPAAWQYGVTVEVDGVVVDSNLVVGPGTDTITVNLTEDQSDGQATVKYYVTDATEWDLVPDGLDWQDTFSAEGSPETAFRTFDVDTDCSDPEPTPGVSFTDSTQCGVFTVTVTSNDDMPAAWQYGVTVEVDGVVVDSNLVVGPGTDTITVNLTEDQSDGQATVKYYVTDATEWDLVPDGLDWQDTFSAEGSPETAFRTFDVDTDCQGTPPPPPPPPPASLTANAVGECEAESIVVTISDGADGTVEVVVDGFIVSRDVVDGQATVQGLEPGATYPVTITADGDVLFDGDVAIDDDCTEVEGIVIEPEPTTPPPTEPPVEEPPTLVEDVVIENPAPEPPQPQLAATGIGTVEGLASGLAMMLLGIALVAGTRRREA